jgi:membrane protein implicated in regulation of membrane protease activity
MKGNMMKWMMIGCILALLLFFALPFFGIEGNFGWIIFLALMAVCVIPMFMMGRKNKNGNKKHDEP